jgi:O-antigen/teichoic acid export membrane protein
MLSGLRWSVWLSALAVPFSAGINLLLARVGPETIGTYGLLSVYIGLVAAFLYLGGDTVVIRFIPECKREDRISFLASYLAIICASLVGWLVFIHYFPGLVRLVFGKGGGGDRFHFLILCVAPIPIAFNMTMSALKGMLEIRWSQALAKTLTLGSLFTYTAIFFIARSWLAHYAGEVIWSVYLGFMAVLLTIGLTRVVRVSGISKLRFYLPNGFWRYAMHTQQVSLFEFFSQRLDAVLILNFGGLETLGLYVAVMSIALTISTVSVFFMDTLLPSLTNTIAAKNLAGAGQVFMMHMRILFVIVTAISSGIIALAVPATSLMGAKYLTLQPMVIVAAAFIGISTPGYFGGALLASVGKQQRSIAASALRLVLFVPLFAVLWAHFHLFGGVVAFGLSVITANATCMAIARRTAPFYPSISSLWLKSAGALVATAGAALFWMPLGMLPAILVWLCGMTLFLWLGHYSVSECQELLRTFVPALARRPGKSNSKDQRLAETPEPATAAYSHAE